VVFNLKWLAGFFDGEGSVGIYPRNQNRTKTIRYYVLVVSLAQSGDRGKAVLDACKDRWGGSVYAQKHGDDVPASKVMWKWNVSSDKALQFLNDIFPYTYIKQEQISHALMYRELDSKVFGTEEADALALIIKKLKQ